MKEKDKIYDFSHLCDSCLHILFERGEIDSLPSENTLERKGYCYNCGQPILSETNEFSHDLDLLESALYNPKLKVVCYTAPSVRVALGDEFGMPVGSFVEGKMVASLKKLGFSAVFDMNTGADFTILEEANEFYERLMQNKNLPMFTSCCPGWVNYAVMMHPELKSHLSTCKSPQQMFGAIINSVYAKASGIDPKDIFVVSIVPCVAKKVENKQAGINSSKGYDVDVAITTREIASLIKSRGIDFANLEDQKFDNFFGTASGAGAIFGNTGGVMEAVLRTVGDRLTNGQCKRLEFNMVRGLDNVRRAEVKFGERTVKLAVVVGLKNVETILAELKADPHKYDFVEVMACDGGCIGGAGQPRPSDMELSEVLKLRSAGLYQGALKRQAKRAHKNSAVMQVYTNYLGDIGSTKARKLLHRKYN